MSDLDDIILIERYIDNDLSMSEKLEVENRLKNDSIFNELYTDSLLMNQLIVHDKYNYIVDKLKEEFKNDDSSSSSTNNNLIISVIVVAIIFVGGIFYFYPKSKNKNSVSSSESVTKSNIQVDKNDSIVPKLANTSQSSIEINNKLENIDTATEHVFDKSEILPTKLEVGNDVLQSVDDEKLISNQNFVNVDNTQKSDKQIVKKEKLDNINPISPSFEENKKNDFMVSMKNPIWKIEDCPSRGVLEIYSQEGQFITKFDISKDNKDSWNLENQNGQPVQLGLYLFSITDLDNLKTISGSILVRE